MEYLKKFNLLNILYYLGIQLKVELELLYNILCHFM